MKVVNFPSSCWFFSPRSQLAGIPGACANSKRFQTDSLNAGNRLPPRVTHCSAFRRKESGSMTISYRIAAVFGLGLLLLPVAASADQSTTWGTHYLNAREARQNARTDAGIANGSLTANEVNRIDRREQHL